MKLGIGSIVVAILAGLCFAFFRRDTPENSITSIGNHIDSALYTGEREEEEEFILSATTGLVVDSYGQALLLMEKYKKNNDVTLLTDIIRLLLQSHHYEEAVVYLNLLDKQVVLEKSLSIETIFLALLNGIELNFKNIDTLKGLLQKYSDQGLVSKDQFAVYSALITFTRGDYNNYSYFMDQLSTEGQYSGWKTSFNTIKQQYYSYPNASTSYLDSLIALDIFKRGYINVARTNALQIATKDPNYLLPKQILAYSEIFLGNRSLALGYFDELTDKDVNNGDLYRYFKGIALYELQKYQESILSFSQISQASQDKDIQQYLFLNYYALKDWNKLHEVIGTLSHMSLESHEYLALFYPLVWEPITQGSGLDLEERLKQSLGELLRKCYQEISAEQSYVCLYAKAGILYAQGEGDRSYDALRQLVVYYPQDYLYEALVVLAQRKGNALLARKYLGRASSLKNQDEKKLMQQRILQRLQ